METFEERLQKEIFIRSHESHRLKASTCIHRVTKNATRVLVDFKAGMTSLLVAAWGHDSVKPNKNLTFMVSL